jgi:mannose-6-phosphate isomerase
MGSGELYELVGQIQHYAWGGHTFIPRLLGLAPEPHTPYAEYWMGAHPKAPARVLLDNGQSERLDKLIAEDPVRVLGQQCIDTHGQLPYLFKVLDVANPLSIQVHPTRTQAEAGFRRENDLGIPIDAPERNYRDRNHKPELMVALGDFWLLHGFLPESKLQTVLQDVPEFHSLQSIFGHGGYAGLYSHVMRMSQDEVDDLLSPLVTRVRASGELDITSADYWAAKVAEDTGDGPFDRGVFSIYFFNLVRVTQGESLFQDAGIPHAYLQGQCIEVMANSDNVLRGGITVKHIDVPELLRTTRFEGIHPNVVAGVHTGHGKEEVFPAPTDSFQLGSISLELGESYHKAALTTEILLIMDGAVTAQSDDKYLSLERGQSAVMFSGSTYQVKAVAPGTQLYYVSVPLINY